MPGFNAAESLDDYAYDFTTVGGPKGQIPMPSAQEVIKFRDQIYAGEAAVTGIEIDSITSEDKALEYDKKLGLLNSAEREQIFASGLEAVIELCKGSPTREQIEALPMPVQVRFVNYVRGLLRPLS